MSINKMFFSTIMMVFLFSACSMDYFNQTQGNMPSSKEIAEVKINMTKSDVQQILGSPSVISSLDGRTWIYMNNTINKVAFFKPTEVERNVLAIEFNLDGYVENIQRVFLEDGKKIAIASDTTPVEGSELTFIEKYFGGVGYNPMQGIQ